MNINVKQLIVPVGDQKRGVSFPVGPETQYYGWWSMLNIHEGTPHPLGWG